VRIVGGSDAGINPGKRHGVLPEALIQLVFALGGNRSHADARASGEGVTRLIHLPAR
jgi:hypothetical protein